jgi:hypothetical protein
MAHQPQPPTAPLTVPRVPAGPTSPPGTLLYCLAQATVGTPLTILVDTATVGGASIWTSTAGSVTVAAGVVITVKPAPGNTVATIGGAADLLLGNAGASVSFENVLFTGTHHYQANLATTALAFTDCAFEPSTPISANALLYVGAGAKLTVTRTRFSAVTATGRERGGRALGGIEPGHPSAVAADALPSRRPNEQGGRAPRQSARRAPAPLATPPP